MFVLATFSCYENFENIQYQSSVGFCEMMSACFPEFGSINHNTICQWMYELEGKLHQQEPEEINNSIIEITLPEIAPKTPRYHKNKTFQCFHQMFVNVYMFFVFFPPRSHNNSESTDPPKRIHKISEMSDGGSTDSSCCDFSEEIDVLQEMFPHVCSIEVN